jgi:2-polyprenyl-3-methyl-5-hydroxy-6-metoxy-1,4-benzoquinol methylase
VSRYEVDIELRNPNDSHTQVVELAGDDKRVLDVGCATGDIARLLNLRGCRVDGLEIDPDAAEKARADLGKVVIADLNTSSLTNHFEAGAYDVVIFADVLEHLLDPERALREAVELLAEGGRVVMSVPNVTHGSVRLALLQGRWSYTDTGLLDRTHVRFFTRSSFVDLIEGAGLAVEDLRSTLADPLAVEVEVDPRRIPPTVVEWVRHQPEALNYQFVASAVRAEASGEPPRRPDLRPAVPNDTVKADDEWTQQMNREQALKQHLLTVRDHIIGMEQRVASAETRQAEAEALLARVRKRANAQRKELHDLRESRAYRAGRALMRPLGGGRPGKGDAK